MSEETTVLGEEKIAAAETEIGSGLWGEKVATIAPKVELQTPAAEVILPKIEDEEEILDPVEWLKREFEVDDPAILKAEREELKALKANPPKSEEIKFNDEESKHIYQLVSEGKESRKKLREHLEKQEQIETLSSIPVDKDSAEEIIKLQMRIKHPELTSKEIDFEYKQNYSIPKQPVQRATEEEEEFNERTSEWKEQVANIEMKRVIAAKTAQPELSKLKSEVILPPIQKIETQQVNNAPTQEELDAIKKSIGNFIQGVESDLKNFNEISVTVDDKDVKIPVSYIFSPEEKAEVNAQLKVLAEQNFNANAVFAERWINQDNTFNVSRMIRDLAILNNSDKMNLKFAQDAASKRLNEYTKEKKNIQLEGITTRQNGQLEATQVMDKVAEALWK